MADDAEFTLDDSFYAPVSDEDPAGPNLSREAEFFQFKEACTEKPERYDPVLNKELPAEPPNWRSAHPMGVALAKQTKDMHVLTMLTQAELAMNGASGLAGALHLMLSTLKDYWVEMHPKADEDDDYWERAAAVRALNSANVLARPIELAPIHVSRAAGPITLRTLGIAKGDVTAREGELALAADQLNQLIADEDGAPEAFGLAHRASATARGLLEEIESFVSSQEGSETVSLSDPIAALAKFEAAIAPFAGDLPAGGTEDTGQEAEIGGTETVTSTQPKTDIPDRDAAVTLINSVIEYYAQNETTNPVPFVLIKLRDMMDYSFSDIVQAVAPNGWEAAALPLGGMPASVLGGAPGATATPASQPVLDWTGIDRAIASTGKKVTALKEGAEKVKAALPPPPAEGEEGDAPAPADLEKLAAAVEKELGTVRAIMESMKGPDEPAAAPGEAPEGDGSINNRADVKVALDRLARYFDAAEPSSPAAAFIRRARPLVDMGFLDIVKELAEKGAGNAQLTLLKN